MYSWQKLETYKSKKGSVGLWCMYSHGRSIYRLQRAPIIPTGWTGYSRAQIDLHIKREGLTK